MDMVERVTEALRAAVDAQGQAWHDSNPGEKTVCVDGMLLLDDLARAAIAAMREPTLEMVEAADAAMRMKVAEGPGRLETLRHGYMAAVNAALTSSVPATPSSE